MRGVHQVAMLFKRDSRCVQLFRRPAEVARDERDLGLGNDAPRARQEIARKVLGRAATGAVESQHVWLQLPTRWPAEDFAREARQRGVIVTPGREFAVARHAAPNAVRICLGPPADRATLKKALVTLAEILDDTPKAFGTAV